VDTVILRRVATLLGAVCLFVLSAIAADRGAILSTIRVDSNLVLIPVSVTDAKNHPVTGLHREDFRVFEGRTEQTLAQFAAEDAPLSIGIVFDSSESMKDKLDHARQAVSRFLTEANPRDEFFLVDFNSTARLAVPFTGDPDDIQSRLLSERSDGRTALLDAVCLAMDYMKHAHHARKALLLISDGADNDSRYTESEIRSRVRESDLWIYTIGIFGNSTPMLPEGDHGERLLAALAEESGGRHFALRTSAELPAVAATIGLELRNQYVIGYRPTLAVHGGKYHRVQVKIADRRDLRVASRPGYFDPQ
jgi:VWFA-related protein